MSTANFKFERTTTDGTVSLALSVVDARSIFARVRFHA